MPKSLFGKMPKSARDDSENAFAISFNPMELLNNDEEMVDFYGDGWFEPQDIVQMQVFPGQFDLLTSLYVLDQDDYFDFAPGNLIDTKEDKAIVFGYSIPKNWEERQLKVDPTNKKWVFELLYNGKFRRFVPPLVAISVRPSSWTNSTKKLSELKQLTISDMSPNEFIGWLDYADSLIRGSDENGDQVFAYLMKSVIELHGAASNRLAYICWRIAQANERFTTLSDSGLYLNSLPWLKKARQIYDHSKPFDKYESQLANPKLEDIDEKITKCLKKYNDITDIQVENEFTSFLE